MLYYKIMTTLQQIGNNDLLEKYYQEINTCIPMNEEQKDLLEVIKEILDKEYEYEKRFIFNETWTNII